MINNGILGEAKVIAYFIEQGYDVFNQFGGKAPFDLVVHKNNVLYKVSVKSVTYLRNNTYELNLSRIRPNRTKTVIHQFDSASVDLVAVYVIPEDRIIIIESKTITSKTTYRIPRLAESG